ncbi:hypothetical protein [Bacillus thuringiensis]|uniref:hypothetical protein n=1 Tax=Bacillus thuringiensis TaxID=1428 RepID=UPI000B43F7A7|nr:hypothetical protein [Bacillus thuringiensis]MED3181421.1 hypothetical protein [Bacillus thuringiensis]OTY12906.1 hypothetical protein BK734_10290 [Bacillus thuringiensis serovar kim]OUB13684.1 hypothetical protein BK733_27545 [Bacillus thuringiensis serovar xiaguangiensis]
MSRKLLTRKDSPNIYSVVDKMSAALGIKDINVYEYDSEQYTGEASSKGLAFPSALIRDAQLHPHVFEFFVGHELIHFYNKEYGLKQAWSFAVAALSTVVMMKRPLQIDNAKRLLKEMRANIDGAALAGLNNTQIVNAQNLAQAKNNDSRIPDSYKVGYPDRNMISNYCTAYQKFDEGVARKILDDFCTKMDVADKDQFIDEIVEDFFN